jgi:hypothetical protein
MHDALDACGKAFGFALASLLTQPMPFTPERLKTFAAELDTLNENGQFSVDVGAVMGGITFGLIARQTARPPGDWIDPGQLL